MGDDLVCTACEMLVYWVQNQLKEKDTKDQVFDYVNQVIYERNLISAHNTKLTFLFMYDLNFHYYFLIFKAL